MPLRQVGYTIVYHESNNLALGNSLALRIPKSAIDAAGFREGDVVDIQEEGGALRIARSSRIDIDEMIESIDPTTIHAEVNWGQAFGRELW